MEKEIRLFVCLKVENTYTHTCTHTHTHMVHVIHMFLQSSYLREIKGKKREKLEKESELHKVLLLFSPYTSHTHRHTQTQRHTSHITHIPCLASALTLCGDDVAQADHHGLALVIVHVVGAVAVARRHGERLSARRAGAAVSKFCASVLSTGEEEVARGEERRSDRERQGRTKAERERE